MKTFTKIFATMLAGALVFGVSSCEKEPKNNGTDTSVNSGLVLSRTSVDFTNDDYTVAGDGVISYEPVGVGVETKFEWSVSSEPEWIIIDRKEGDNTGFTVDVTPYGPWGATVREGVVKVTANGKEYSVAVKQERHDIVTFADFIGKFTVHADLVNARKPATDATFYSEWAAERGYPDYYSAEVTMVDDSQGGGANDEMHMQDVMKYYEGYFMDFIYDEQTRKLEFVSKGYGMYNTIFAYMNDEGTALVTLDATQKVYAGIDADSGELVVDKTITIDGKEKELYFLAYSFSIKMTWSRDAMHNIRFVKTIEEIE